MYTNTGASDAGCLPMPWHQSMTARNSEYRLQVATERHILRDDCAALQHVLCAAHGMSTHRRSVQGQAEV